MFFTNGKAETYVIYGLAYLIATQGINVAQSKFGPNISFTDFVSTVLHNYPISFPDQKDLQLHFETRKICTELLSANQNSFELAATHINGTADRLEAICDGMKQRELLKQSAKSIYDRAPR